MWALVHAELLKVRSTRTTLGLLVATLALVTLTVTFSTPKAGDATTPIPLDDPSLLASIVGISFGVPLVLVVLLGGLTFTQEFRYGTCTLTYLGEPQRTRILLAKLLAAALCSLAVTAVTLALSVPMTIALISSRGGLVHVGPLFWEVLGAATAVMALYAVIGVALGALIRNQITAVVGVLVWMLVVEQVVIPALPSVGRWLPGGSTDAVLHLGPTIGLDGKLLSAAVGALMLLAYAAAAVLLAVRLTPRRDVL